MWIGKATLISFQVLPMTVMLMSIVPKNIEASCFAVISALLTFSTDWAGSMIGAFICQSFNITVKDMSNYHLVIILKMAMILLACLLTEILPTNTEIEAIRNQMRKRQSKHIKGQPNTSKTPDVPGI